MFSFLLLIGAVSTLEPGGIQLNWSHDDSDSKKSTKPVLDRDSRVAAIQRILEKDPDFPPKVTKIPIGPFPSPAPVSLMVWSSLKNI